MPPLGDEVQVHLADRGCVPVGVVGGPLAAVAVPGAHAVARGPEHPGTGPHAVGDVLEWEPSEAPDFVVASGIFGLDSRDARARIRPTLRRMFEWARVGMACNFLSQRSLEPAENRVYVDPAEALEMALALTPAVRLDHSYLPNDFTLYLEKTPAWQRGNGGA